MSLLGAIAGGDVINILVTMENLSGAGFKNVEKDLGNLGKSGKGASLGLGSLVTPLTLVAAGVAAVAGVGAATIPTYEAMRKLTQELTQAAYAHKVSLVALWTVMPDLVTAAEKYGKTQTDVYQTTTQLIQAGLDLKTVQASLPAIYDLAVAKNISLADAATSFTTAVMGNARALKQFGILVPAITGAAADVGKATTNAAKAQFALKTATEELLIVEHKGMSKHETYAQRALALQKAHEKVTVATANVKTAEEKLTLARQGGVDKTARAALVSGDLTRALGDQSSTISPLAVAQAKLNDAWTNFAMQTGPGFADILTRITTGLGTAITNGLGVAQAFGDMIGRLSALQPVKDFFFDLSKILEGISQFATGVLLPALEDIGAFFSNIILPSITNFIGAMGEGLSVVIATLSNIFGWVHDIISAVSGALGLGGKVGNRSVPHGAGSAGGGGALRAHAAGGWVGLSGPEFSMVGEQGPEFISPTPHAGGGGGASVHVVQVYLDGKQITQAVEKRMARNYRLAAVTSRPYGSY